MNILAGLYRPDEGEIRLDGQPVSFGSPRDAIEAGLGMVHQHFTLVPSQTVTENILLGLDRPRFLLDARRSEAEVARLAAEFGLRVHPRAKIWQLSVGEQQRVEILKLLYRGARILIMDEPTAVLAPQEIGGPVPDAEGDGRRRPERRLHQPQAERGARDRRPGHGHAPGQGDGRRDPGGRRRPSATSPASWSVATCSSLYERSASAPGEVLLSVRDVEADNDRGLPALRGVSLEVRAGEIVGIAAVAGNGQTELAEVITGLRPCARQRVRSAARR